MMQHRLVLLSHPKAVAQNIFLYKIWGTHFSFQALLSIITSFIIKNFSSSKFFCTQYIFYLAPYIEQTFLYPHVINIIITFIKHLSKPST